MVMAEPHFLLFCETHVGGEGDDGAVRTGGIGRWHFVLEQIGGVSRLEAGDAEARSPRDRLDLLAVVRGLEALEQPSKVTLVTTSRYVARGLRYGLSSWRESDYHWERFGVQMPIRNADLWQRVDVAMKFHGLNCRLIQAGAGLVNACDPDEIGWGQSPPSADAGLSPEWGSSHQLNQVRRPAAAAKVEHSVLAWIENWWKLTSAWKKWWQNRQHALPAAYGA